MKISDIIAMAQGESSRFRKWLCWTLAKEVSLDRGGNIIPENDEDGEGITFAGMTQRSDDLPVDSCGNVTASPGWMVTRYLLGYWSPLAPQLPYPVGECVANFALTDGPSPAVRFLQEALNDLGLSVAVDGVLGSRTLAAAWKLTNEDALARRLCSHAINYYHAVGVGDRSRDLQGWLNRTDDLLLTFCS